MSDVESRSWYDGLPSGVILDRLEAAEKALLLLGWTAYRGDTDRDKALHELWCEWVDLVPEEFTRPKNHPELSDEAIAPLARRRDATVATTLAAIRGAA